MSAPATPDNLTDDEWLRLIAECPPSLPMIEALILVNQWRNDGDSTGGRS